MPALQDRKRAVEEAEAAEEEEAPECKKAKAAEEEVR